LSFRFSLPTPTKTFFKNLPELEAADREGDGLRKEAGTAEYRPEQKPPVMEPLFSDDPENLYF
jgi:hypothetical protein